MSIEVEYNLTGNHVPDYAMFTELGNAAVHAIVVTAKANQMTWSQVLRALEVVSQNDLFAEATDTAVRECVFDALDFANQDVNFYGD